MSVSSAMEADWSWDILVGTFVHIVRELERRRSRLIIPKYFCVMLNNFLGQDGKYDGKDPVFLL